MPSNEKSLSNKLVAALMFTKKSREDLFNAVYTELSLVQQAFKKRKTSKRSLYNDVAFIPPTSNECERFFSAVKLVYTDLRKRLDASTLEMLMFLMYNKDMWMCTLSNRLDRR
ncbi:Ribonuclease H-like domain [Phytophthora cactorum]|nr:Ribonuclease H-like domain [Phytophthora cactorum]